MPTTALPRIHRRSHGASIAALALAALAAATQAAPPRYTIAAVPSLPGRNTRLDAISNGIAGGDANLRGSGGSTLGVEVRGHTLRQIEVGASTTTTVDAVNAMGAVAGVATLAGDCCTHAFFARGAQAAPQWLFAPGSDYQSRIDGVNDDGLMVGAAQFASTGVPSAFLAAPDRRIELIPPLAAGLPGHATAVNASGTVVGAMGVEASRTIEHAFAWRQGAPIELPMPGAWLADSQANAINAQGWIVGWAQIPLAGAGASTHAVMWREREIVDLGFDLGTIANVARGINSSGVVVGTRIASDGSAHGWVWVDGAHADLDTLVDGLPAGITIYEAAAIDEQGRIAVNLLDAAHARRGRGAVLTPVAGE